MSIPTTLPLCLALFLISAVYASVGQAGASGFIAVMALFGIAAASIKPTALVLNVLVSSVVIWRFWRAGFLSWHKLWPFAIASLPAAFIGGYLTLPITIFNEVLGTLLAIASTPLLLRIPMLDQDPSPPSLPTACFAGGVIGLLSGLTGMGGGVLLAPLLICCRWYDTRTAAGISGAFILLNSVVALLGHLSAGHALPTQWSAFAVAAVLGGALGAQIGSRYLPVSMIQRLLGLILLLGGLKLFFA